MDFVIIVQPVECESSVGLMHAKNFCPKTRTVQPISKTLRQRIIHENVCHFWAHLIIFPTDTFANVICFYQNVWWCGGHFCYIACMGAYTLSWRQKVKHVNSSGPWIRQPFKWSHFGWASKLTFTIEAKLNFPQFAHAHYVVSHIS